MTNVSCAQNRIDGELVAPCTTCRLILENLVDDEGRIVDLVAPEITRGDLTSFNEIVKDWPIVGQRKETIEEVIDSSCDGILVRTVSFGGLHHGLETVPINRLGGKTPDTLVGKVITYEVKQNNVGTQSLRLISVRKPRS